MREIDGDGGGWRESQRAREEDIGLEASRARRLGWMGHELAEGWGGMGGQG